MREVRIRRPATRLCPGMGVRGELMGMGVREVRIRSVKVQQPMEVELNLVHSLNEPAAVGPESHPRQFLCAS